MAFLDTLVGWVTGKVADSYEYLPSPVTTKVEVAPGLYRSVYSPSAPITRGAMTQPGVWTPDYAIYRTQEEIQNQTNMASAAANAQTYGELFPEEPISWPFAIAAGIGIIGAISLLRGK